MSTNVFIIALCVAAPFLVLGIIFIVVALNMRRKAAASQNWPTVPGVITSASVAESVSSDEDGPSTSYQPRVVYTYQVAGVDYQASGLSFGAVRSGSRRSAEQALQAYPVGQPVTVHYNPQKPSEAVLNPQAGGSKAFLIAGIVLAVLGLMIGCVGIVFALVSLASS